VGLSSAVGDVQAPRDACIRQTFDDQLDNLSLTGAQWFGRFAHPSARMSLDARRRATAAIFCL
jgi:hypothetical protein